MKNKITNIILIIIFPITVILAFIALITNSNTIAYTSLLIFMLSLVILFKLIKQK